MYVEHLSVLSITGTPQTLMIIGYFEIALGVLTIIKPNIGLIWFVLAWKVFTEALYPFAGKFFDIFETIERSGDYGGPTALLFILYFLKLKQEVPSRESSKEQLGPAHSSEG